MTRTCARLLAVALLGGLFFATATRGLAQWGTVKGKVILDGKVPPKIKANVNKDEKFCNSKGIVFTEDWVVDPKTKGVRDVFVWLMPATAKKFSADKIHPKLRQIKKKQVFIHQPCCTFIPHALAMREGQQLVVTNKADVQHNFRYQGRPSTAGGGNFIILPGKQTEIKKMFKADYLVPIIVGCDFHRWMRGTVRVFDHPYYAVTNDKGEFTIPMAPVGRYRLVIWHRSAGYLGGAAGRNGTLIVIRPGMTNVGSKKLTK